MKFKTKVKPLFLAISFSMMAMSTGQILLFRETTDSLISHCREINRQNISFYNLLANTALIPSGNFDERSKNPKYCSQFIDKETNTYLDQVKRYKTNDFFEKLNLANERIRLYADNYQILQNKRAKTTKNLLVFVLIMNVSGLAAMSVFLRFDTIEE
ncbi:MULTISPECIES: hypothetical protein [Prochlorococcus]|uniref:Uncharacterized protein n=1 Tax=Prochlorococcus marinus str. MIT 9116 TaxID=167544 RepID=A0A0A1ZRV4_PROMR|nr:hypothetical protein [Prochlorococcus marinus]KGF89824.1 hypothetical protein EU92_1615 [Prochlorococcus marinus str. MIT 9107]KGF92327.1 hypothetical protein EU93_0591 [Prochlorococcus marinus str. MIT 9116]KGF92645.1 hypothetical protein EU94_1643 [Prochlorococcus marinus str. MIT 9123]